MKWLTHRALGLTWLCFAALTGCDPSGGIGPWKLQEKRTHWSSIEDLERHRAAQRSEPSGGIFDLILPLGMTREEFALIGRERVDLGTGAKVLERRQGSYQWGAYIAAMGSVHVGESARVGTVYNLGEGPTVIGRRASVSGYIKAAGELRRSPESVLRVGAMEHARRNLEMYSLSVAFPDGVSDVRHEERAQRLALDPGAYGRVSVAAGCVLRITAGQYSLRGLTVEAGATLEIDNSGGPVHLWVRDELGLSGEMTSLAPLYNVLLGFGGSSPLQLTSPFRGILLAPDSEVALLAAPRPHEGSVFARAITVGERAELEHHPFSDERESAAEEKK